MYTYPNLSAVVASRSFYKADTVNFAWNKKGKLFALYNILPTCNIMSVQMHAINRLPCPFLASLLIACI